MKRCTQRPIYNHLGNTCLGEIDSQRAHFKKKITYVLVLPQCECCRVASKVGERRKPKSTRTFHQVCPSSLALLCNLLHASWLSETSKERTPPPLFQFLQEYSVLTGRRLLVRKSCRASPFISEMVFIWHRWVFANTTGPLGSHIKSCVLMQNPTRC